MLKYFCQTNNNDISIRFSKNNFTTNKNTFPFSSFIRFLFTQWNAPKQSFSCFPKVVIFHNGNILQEGMNDIVD